MKNRLLAHMGWPLLTILIGTPIVLWYLMMPIGVRFDTPYMTLGSAGRLAGIVAMVLFCLNVILTSRMSWLETIFGGLNKLYFAHHVIGGTALIVLLTHPVLFSLRGLLSSPRDAALQALPFTTDTATTIGVLSLWLFIALMIMTLYIKLPYKTWLLTHKFMGLVLLGIALHILLGSSDIRASMPLKFYSVGLLGAALATFVARTLLPGITARRYRYVIADVTALSQNIIRMTLAPKSKSLKHAAGQFLFLSLRAEGVSHEWHPFSIASNDPEKGLVVIVKALGSYTSTLVRIGPGLVGTDVGVEGAYGRFNYRTFRRKRQIWVAGGIGITPFLAMAQDIPPDYSIDLYYAVRTQQDAIEWSTLQRTTAAQEKRLRVFPIISDAGDQITAGRITELSGDVHDTEILLCGPPPMMHALHDQLTRIGLKRNQIHTEEFAIT